MNAAEWALLGISTAVLVLGVGRAIYVSGYRRGVASERWRAMRVGEALRGAGRRAA